MKYAFQEDVDKVDKSNLVNLISCTSQNLNDSGLKRLCLAKHMDSVTIFQNIIIMKASRSL